jgi:TP901 family phage tail tape measure protein
MAVGMNLGPMLATIGVNTREWFSGLDKAQKRWVKFGAQLQVTGFRMMTVWGATFGAAGAAVAKFGASFEKEFVGVKKTVEGSDKQFAQLKETLLGTAKATGMSADQLAVLARKGGQLGVATEDLGHFTDTLAKLSIAAAELDPDEAATALARMMNITGTNLKDIDIVASVLADLGDKFATTEDRILNFSQRISGLGKVTNMTAVDILGLGAAFTATVPGVELVATQVSKSMGIFVKAVAEGGAELEVLNKMIGGDFKETFEKDAAGAIAQFLAGLDKLSKGDAIRALKDLHLTNQRAAQAFLSAAKNSDQFTRALSEARREADMARTSQGKLNRVFEEQMKTVGAKWGQVWERARAVFIRVFDAFADEIKTFLDWGMVLLEWAEEVAKALEIIPKPIAMLGIVIIALAGVMATALTGAGMFVSVYGTMIPMFATLKTALVAFSGAQVAATGKTTAWSIAALKGGTTTVGWGKAIAGTTLKLAKFAGVMALAAGAFAVGWEAGTNLREVFPGLVKWTDKYYESLWRVLGLAKSNSEILADTAQLNHKVADAIMRNSRTTGETYTKMELLGKTNTELNNILAEQLKVMRETESGIKEYGDAAEDAGFDTRTWAERTEELTKAWGSYITAIGGAIDLTAEWVKTSREFSESRFQEALKGMTDDLAKWDFTGDAPWEDTSFQFQFAPVGMPDMPTAGLPDYSSEMDKMTASTFDASDALKQWKKNIATANHIGQLFGGTIGEIISQSMAAGTSIAAIAEGGGLGNIFKSSSEKAGDGIMGAISGGLAVAGPIAAIASTAINIFKKVFAKDPRWKTIAKESANIFGKSFSEELAKSVEASEKGGLGFGEALAANIGSIVEEIGVDAGNIQDMWGHFFLGLDTGVASAEELGKAFVGIKEHLTTMGLEGSHQIGEMTRRMAEAGVVTAELKAHIQEQSQVLLDSLAPALSWISNLTNMTSEDAVALQGVIVAAWGAAIAQTGSFIQAVGLLGEEFTNALFAIQEVLGPEGQNLVGPISEIVNVVNNSEGALEALAGITQGLDAMAQMGILTAESLNSMGEAIRVSFEKAVEATGNETGALKAAWPELVKLFNQFKQMGMEVPPWLDEIIAKGEDMGLSMEMPLGTTEALNAILDVLLSIASALGAVASEAKSAGNAISNIPDAQGPSGRGGEVAAQVGFQGDVLRPTSIRVGESGPEHVEVTPQGPGSDSGGGGDTILMIDSVELGRVISEGSKTGKVRIMPTAVREF